MKTSAKVGVAVLLAGVAGFGGLAGQTSKNPISTKPEGSTPNCSYSGTVGNDGKSTTSSACTPNPTPGTGPNQIAPVVPAQQRFPFPGDTPSLQGSPAVPDAGPAVPSAPGSQAPSPDAGRRFPFPGETGNEAAAPAGGSSRSGPPAPGNAPALQDAGSSGDASGGSSASSSSSSSSSSSRSQAEPNYSSSSVGPDLPDDDPNAPMPTPHRTLRKKLPKEKKALTTDEQEAEDVQIAAFYQNDGNYKAAYQRAKEAVSLVADDPEAYVAVGDAARKLGKLDEAGASYKKALALDPVPKIRRAAEKALKEMSGS